MATVNRRRIVAARLPSSIYRLKIKLLGIEPPIWRRIQVPGSIRFCCLHTALQVALGWTDSHLHRFEKDGKEWGVPEYDELGDFDLVDERTTQLSTVLKAEGESMMYIYDYGDGWIHKVVLEEIIPVNDVLKTPICFGGERRCPPEDVGGVSGYEQFLDVIFDPGHEDFDRLREWAGDTFQPEEFDIRAINLKLSLLRWPIRHRR